MVCRGDFNEIREGSKKRGDRVRSEGSYSFFRDFIREMEMTEIRFTGRE